MIAFVPIVGIMYPITPTAGESMKAWVTVFSFNVLLAFMNVVFATIHYDRGNNLLYLLHVGFASFHIVMVINFLWTVFGETEQD